MKPSFRPRHSSAMRSGSVFFAGVLFVSVLLNEQIANATERTDIPVGSPSPSIGYESVLIKARLAGSGIRLPNGDVVTSCHSLGFGQPGGISNVAGMVDVFGYKYRETYDGRNYDTCILTRGAPVEKVDTVNAVVGERITVRGYMDGRPFVIPGRVAEVSVSGMIRLDARWDIGASGAGVYNDKGGLVGMAAYYLETEGEQRTFWAVPSSAIELTYRSPRITTDRVDGSLYATYDIYRFRQDGRQLFVSGAPK